MAIEGHIHVIDKSQILLFKDLKFISCRDCGKSLEDILAEAKNDKEGH
jgi:hypothetical protein